jgi:glycosyltransferase involved in cell wall biosynthesis
VGAAAHRVDAVTMPPLVSVIVPVFNGAAFVAEGVGSALAQTWPALEVIVVDDGSRDAPPAILDALAARDPRVQVVHQANAGPSAARNAGLERARGAYVAFLDADDRLLPHKLADQVAALEADPSVDLVYGEVHYVEDGGGRVWDPRRGAPPLPFDRLLRYRNWFAPPAPLLRRRLVDAVGGFDPAMRTSEDWDYWLRCLHHTDFRFVPGVVAHYRLHGEQSHRDREKMDVGHRQLLAKHFADDPLARRRHLAFRHLADAMAWRTEGAPGRTLAALIRFAAAARTPDELRTVWRLARLHPVEVPGSAEGPEPREGHRG